MLFLLLCFVYPTFIIVCFFFFFNDTATTEIYTYYTLFPYTTLFRSAEAVQALFPGTQITFGPATADGFYYDFAPTADHGPFRDDELPLIEAEMRRIIAADKVLRREVWDRDALIARWQKEIGGAHV